MSKEDHLSGGAGLDTYRFESLWGRDAIEDSDGQGAIEVAGFGTLSGQDAKKIAEDQWVSADGKVHYTAVSAVGATQLHIAFQGAADTLRIDGWTSGNLGITLGGTVVPPATDRTYVGDFAKQVVGSSYVISGGNYVFAGALPGADDEITASAAADRMLGLLGNDALAGLDGDDHIEGGDGDDLLLGRPRQGPALRRCRPGLHLRLGRGHAGIAPVEQHAASGGRRAGACARLLMGGVRQRRGWQRLCDLQGPRRIAEQPYPSKGDLPWRRAA